MQIQSSPNPNFDVYYADLAAIAGQGAAHESATRLAFTKLLDLYGKQAEWTLILEQKLSGSRKRPDATLQDAFKIPRGYWEAKDTKDDLDAEVLSKIKIGYPTTNIIFEDTRRAVLYQNGERVFEADLNKPEQLASLLEQFFNHTPEQVQQFYEAFQIFLNDLPTLAANLNSVIAAQHATNRAFQDAFTDLRLLCRASLNPQITDNAIDVMLVQHLLTERLFRTVFDNPEFVRRNVIAREIDGVIDALASHSFSRGEFLKSLDYFYVAIENTARTITTFSEKQGFINAVYEQFFQRYSPDQADTHGIVYTPQTLVDFMCESVEHVLSSEFGLSLSSPGVAILDPCTGTGNFLVNLLRRISPLDLTRKYKEELFANEVMLLPYYIASLNIEHAYFEQMGKYEQFEGLCFADTLDLGSVQPKLALSEENTERMLAESSAPIRVIIGNPPYNIGQKNENDNNKNRKYQLVDERIKKTYAKQSKATLTTKLYDAYVRFFRWATDRLGGQDGVVCFVSNNSFVEQIAFDGMRKTLCEEFDKIYHLDLHGNVRKNPKLSGTKHNVFGIQVGVGITLLIRNKQDSTQFLKYARVPETWDRLEKEIFLKETRDISHIDWRDLQPDAKNDWLTEGMEAGFEAFLPMGTKAAKASGNMDVAAIFKTYSLGVSTNRDSVVYDFDKAKLAARVQTFIKNYNAEVHRWVRDGKPKEIDAYVSYANVKWSRNLKSELKRERYAEFDDKLVRRSLYRPFSSRWLYYADIIVDEPSGTGSYFPTTTSQNENQLLCLCSVGHRANFTALMTASIPNLNLNSTDGFQCFPLYTYAVDGKIRKDNITDWALEKFRAQFGPDVTKRQIFDYVYAALHHPRYRAKYAENLKRELPRIPLVPDADTFRALAESGAKLAALHVGYETADEYPLTQIVNKKTPFSWRVGKMKLNKAKTGVEINDSLTLDGLPPEVWAYKLGSRSALTWVMEQHQADTEKGIDPNRKDDPEYIVRLVRRVVTVSVETVKLVDGLPDLQVN